MPFSQINEQPKNENEDTFKGGNHIKRLKKSVFFITWIISINIQEYVPKLSKRNSESLRFYELIIDRPSDQRQGAWQNEGVGIDTTHWIQKNTEKQEKSCCKLKTVPVRKKRNFYIVLESLIDW